MLLQQALAQWHLSKLKKITVKFNPAPSLLTQ